MITGATPGRICLLPPRCWFTLRAGWFFNLADLNQSNTYVADELLRWGRNMVSTYGIDAVRLDTAPYVPRDFLQRLQEGVGVEIYGEITTSNYSFLSRYMHDAANRPVLAGVFNFPLVFGIREGFCGEWLGDSRDQSGGRSSSGGASGVGVSGSGFSGSGTSSGGSGGSGFSGGGTNGGGFSGGGFSGGGSSGGGFSGGGSSGGGLTEKTSSTGPLSSLARVMAKYDAAVRAGLLKPDAEVHMVDSHDMSRIAHQCDGDLVRVRRPGSNCRAVSRPVWPPFLLAQPQAESWMAGFERIGFHDASPRDSCHHVRHRVWVQLSSAADALVNVVDAV